MKAILFFSCLLWGFWGLEAHAETKKSSDAVSAVRGAYLPLTSSTAGEHQLSRLQAHGINTVLVADGTFSLQEKRWLGWGDMAGRFGLDLWAVLHFAVPRELQERPKSYRPYVNREGNVYQGTPCPLDEHYWHEVIGKRVVRLAELSELSPLNGAAFDAEMYGSEISLYYDLCYCDVCWLEFIRTGSSSLQHNARDLPAGQRFEYLSAHGLLREYTDFEWRWVRNTLGVIRQQIHAKASHFRIGFLGFRHTWFFSALVRGLGTLEHPVWVFSESSYVRGYTPYVDRERKQVLQQGNIARYVPGLWLSRFFPRDLPAQLSDLSTHSDGFWIFNAAYLWEDESGAQELVLHDRPDAYWSALALANDQLDRLRGRVDGLENTLPEVHRSSFYDPQQEQLFRSAELKFLLSSILSASQRESKDSGDSTLKTILYREKTLFHFLKKRGEEHTIRIASIPISDVDQAPFSYILFDDAGRVFQQIKVENQTKTEIITLPAHLAGTFSLLTDSGPNTLSVAFSEELPHLLEASSTFPLTFFNSSAQYAVYIPGGTQWMKVRAYCPADEFASLAVWSAEGARLSQMEVRGGVYGFAEIQSLVRSGDEFSFATLSVGPILSKAFGELRFYLYDAEFPYLFPGSR